MSENTIENFKAAVHLIKPGELKATQAACLKCVFPRDERSAGFVSCKRCCFQQSECGASRPCQVPRGYGDRTFATSLSRSGRVYTIHEPCRAMWMRGASRRTRRYAWTVQCQGVFVLCWKCVPCARSVRLERVPVCFRTRPYHPSIACERNFRHPFTSDHRGADTRCRN